MEKENKSPLKRRAFVYVFSIRDTMNVKNTIAEGAKEQSVVDIPAIDMTKVEV